MRSDVLVEEVFAKCDVLKKAGFWPPEPTLRPRAWLNNFEEPDRKLAALLLDKFTYYNARLTDALLVAAYHSIGDGMPKGPNAPSANQLMRALNNAAFTPVRGERPNPTDSGYFLCRKARQLLDVSEDNVLDTEDALSHAYAGNTVVFLDDFVGSGDQFLLTWERDHNGRSFIDARAKTNFIPIYIALVTTDFGLANIHRDAPDVAVCTTHVLGDKSTINNFAVIDPQLDMDIRALLLKYASRLTPKEEYIAKVASYKQLGYKNRGLMLGFEHSIPDATLPIFWSPGTNNWEPLIERK